MVQNSHCLWFLCLFTSFPFVSSFPTIVRLSGNEMPNISQIVLLFISVLRKQFEVPPYSKSVELGSQIEIRCHPPLGVPKPRVSYDKSSFFPAGEKTLLNAFFRPLQIYWLKDRVEVQPERDSNYIQAADGHLIIIQAREKDRANYTCVAENVANRRLSPPARLNIHSRSIKCLNHLLQKAKKKVTLAVFPLSYTLRVSPVKCFGTLQNLVYQQ